MRKGLEIPGSINILNQHKHLKYLKVLLLLISVKFRLTAEVRDSHLANGSSVKWTLENENLPPVASLTKASSITGFKAERVPLKDLPHVQI